MTHKLVSILVPAYNSSAWIDATIQSALQQSWPHKEVIIVDDGSSDDTLARARRYSSKSVKVVTQVNGGASSARNHAYRLAQGEYIQWLDSDDLLERDKIASQMAWATKESDPMRLYSGAFGEFYCDISQARVEPTRLWRDLLPTEYFSLKFNSNCWFNPSVWLVSREITSVAGSWNEELTLDDDGEYFCRVVAKSSGVTFVENAMSYYRRGNTSSLSRSNSRMACRSLALSLRRCIDEYLRLEASPESRAASIAYLQFFVSTTDIFRGKNQDFLEELAEMARDLGGALDKSVVNRKYWIFRRLFGEQGEIRVRHLARLLRYKVAGKMEHLRMVLRANN